MVINRVAKPTSLGTIQRDLILGAENKKAMESRIGGRDSERHLKDAINGAAKRRPGRLGWNRYSHGCGSACCDTSRHPLPG